MIHTYDASDEGTHTPDAADPDRQESVFVHWYDTRNGIGGVHRIGHEPNRGAGQAALQCAVLTADGKRFRRNDWTLPLQAPSTERGFRAGGSQWHVDGAKPRLQVHEPGLEVDLQMHEFYPLTGFFPSSGSLVDEFAKHHYETSGRIVGEALIDDRRLTIDGLFDRDHSWGLRRIDTLLSHRWVSGTFGPHLSFGSIAWHAADDSFVKVGYLVRNGEVVFADDVDIVTWLEADGLTHRGGEVQWSLPDGQDLRLQCRAVDGVVSQLHDAAYVDTLCTVTTGKETGVCDFEISNNHRAGTRPPAIALAANLSHGLSTRPGN